MTEEKPPRPMGREPEAPAEPVDSAPAGRGFVAEAVRKAVLTGVGALFLTEEGARRLAREWKLPKELASFVVQQAQGAKDEVLRVVSLELRRLLESEAFRREAMKVLGSMAIEVKAEIRLKERPKGRAGKRSPARPRSRRPEPEGERG